MLTWMLNALFGCRHKNTTTPRKVKGVEIVGHDRGNYVSCLDCGAELKYDRIHFPNLPQQRRTTNA